MRSIAQRNRRKPQHFKVPGRAPKTTVDLYTMGMVESDGQIRRVKIGKAVDIEERRRRLQAGCPYELVLLTGGWGRGYQEGAMHATWEHLWCHGEWFTLDDELRHAIVAGEFGDVFDEAEVLMTPVQVAEREAYREDFKRKLKAMPMGWSPGADLGALFFIVEDV